MQSTTVRTGRWPVPSRARVRVRLCRYVFVGRVARVTQRAASPPAGEWRACVMHGRVGYGFVTRAGRVEHWRPLNPMA